MRGCRNVRRWIDRGLDGELGLEESFELDAHVARCPRCARYQRLAQGLEEALQQLPDPPLEGVGVDRALRSVRTTIEADRVLPARRATGGRRVAAAAGVVAVVAATVLVLGRRGEDTDRAGERPAAPDPRTALEAPAPALETLEDVRGRVRATLLESEETSGELLARYDAVERSLAQEEGRWPVLRIVEGLLADEDPAVACRAAQVLGQRGDRISVAGLRRALVRDDVAESALDALAELGPGGVGVLAQALRDERLAAHALVRLAAVGGRAAAEVIADAIESPIGGRTPARADLLNGLVRCGPAAVECLLRLADAPRVTRAEHHEVLAYLELVPDASATLERVVARGQGYSTGVLLAAAARLQPVGLLPWIERICADRAHRDQAFDVLARWEGCEALDLLAQLWSEGGFAPQLLRAPALEILARGPERAVTLARRHARDGDASRSRALLDFLLALEAPEAGAAFVELAVSPVLAADDRQWAALAVGELGRAEDADLLVGALARVDPAEVRLAAAILISIHDLAGEAGVARALGPASERAHGLFVALRQASEQRGAVQLHRVARALGALSPEVAVAQGGNP